MNSYIKQVLFVVSVAFLLRQEVSYSAAENNTSPTAKSTTTDSTTPSTTITTPSSESTANKTTNETQNSKTGDGTIKKFPNGENSGMLERSLYVAVGISALVAIYFVVRWVKTRGRRKAKKYGVIHGTGEPELQPLDKHTDEDEEDIALFDVKDSKRPK